MTFYEWLHMEYLDPEPGDKYHERDMIAAWNQAVACCRKEVRNMVGNNEKPELSDLLVLKLKWIFIMSHIKGKLNAGGLLIHMK